MATNDSNLKKHIPNFITLLNLLSGCIATVFALNGNLGTAAFFVFLGTIFYWIIGRFFTQAPRYRTKSNIKKEEPVINFLENEVEVGAMIIDIQGFLERWLPSFSRNNRSYITIAIGCTGGQHRSVFLAEKLAGHFSELYQNVQVRHREIHPVKTDAHL